MYEANNENHNEDLSGDDGGEGCEPLVTVQLKEGQLNNIAQKLENPLFERLYKKFRHRFQQEEKKMKESYCYEEVRQLLSLQSRRAVRERVRNKNNNLIAQGRNTNSPFILKGDLYTYLVQDLGMNPDKAFDLVY